jgi:ABC-2 type transport system permease protein
MFISNWEEVRNLRDLSFVTRETQRDLAALPYTRPRYTVAAAFRQYWIVLRTLLADYRSELGHQIFLGIIVPIGYAFFARALEGTLDHQQAVFLLGGNITMSIAFGPAGFLLFKLTWARYNHEFQYWATLPLPQIILVLALISIGLFFSLPGIVGIYLFGSFFFGIPLSLNWLFIVIMPLGAFPLAISGAMLGSYATKPEVAGMYYNCIVAFVSFLSPMLIPLQALPVPLRVISWFVPTTYAADAFRAVIGGQIEINVLVDILLLIVFSGVLLALTQRKLDWRAT